MSRAVTMLTALGLGLVLLGGMWLIGQSLPGPSLSVADYFGYFAISDKEANELSGYMIVAGIVCLVPAALKRGVR